MDENWNPAIAATEVPADDVVAINVDGREIALYQAEGEYFATDNICTHGHARLCDGFLYGHEIECPLHQGRFDIRNGHAVCAPATQHIKCYPVRVENGQVLVNLA
jgi:naphthalene 1,2-dioxygenase system ferredoxin subunit